MASITTSKVRLLTVVVFSALVLSCAGDLPPGQMTAAPNAGVGPNNQTGTNGSPGSNGSNGGMDQPAPIVIQCSEEVCDGIDNDCNGQVDEDLACACSDDTSCYGGPPGTRGVGICQDGSRSCPTGEFWDMCSGWVGPEAAETCDDGLDNDCNGIVDDGCEPDLPPEPDPDPETCSSEAGAISGRICTPNGNTFIAGADVVVRWRDCDGNPQTVSAVTDSDGFFQLDGVQAGNRRVEATKGPYNASFDVEVSAGQTATLDSGELCIENDTLNIAVIEGSYDNVQAVLMNLGFDYSLYNASHQLLGDGAALAEFDALFINCGDEAEDGGIPEHYYGNVRNFVAQGGHLYTSDWSYHFIDRGFPGKVNFADVFGDPLIGDDFDGQAQVTDSALQAYLGSSSVPVHLTFSWSVIESVASDVRVFLRANVTYDDGFESLPNAPLMVSFEHGEGSVVFTVYHLEDNGSFNDVFNFMVLEF